jgi:LPXTG-site transpeptidase (sortase) family protein
MSVRRLLPVTAFWVLLAACGTSQGQPAASPAQPAAPASASAGVATQPSAGPETVPTTEPTAQPAPLPALPKELLIPAIHVDAPVEQVGTDPDGAMSAPAEWNDVGWYKGGYRPGQPGNAVMAGHLDSTTDKAVFWDLNKLKKGDQVIVKDDDGSQLTFAVVGSEVYPFDNAPLQKIFGPSGVPMLNLVTCDGTWDKAAKNYNERLVVYTQLISS